MLPNMRDAVRRRFKNRNIEVFFVTIFLVMFIFAFSRELFVSLTAEQCDFVACNYKEALLIVTGVLQSLLLAPIAFAYLLGVKQVILTAVLLVVSFLGWVSFAYFVSGWQKWNSAAAVPLQEGIALRFLVRICWYALSLVAASTFVTVFLFYPYPKEGLSIGLQDHLVVAGITVAILAIFVQNESRFAIKEILSQLIAFGVTGTLLSLMGAMVWFTDRTGHYGSPRATPDIVNAAAMRATELSALGTSILVMFLIFYLTMYCMVMKRKRPMRSRTRKLQSDGGL